MRLPLAPALVLASLVACNQSATGEARAEEPAPASATPVADALDGAFLAGAWVFEGDYCASGLAVRFTEDGGYSDIETEGRWTLADDRLTVLFDDGTQNTLDIERVDDGELIAAGTRARRCSPDGGEEPWYPGETYTTR